MMKYLVTYKGKVYIYNGTSTSDVAVKFGNRKVYGNYAVINMKLKTYDADTRGKKWAEYTADGEPMMIEVMK